MKTKIPIKLEDLNMTREEMEAFLAASRTINRNPEEALTDAPEDDKLPRND
jgi:hypothetical protein